MPEVEALGSAAPGEQWREIPHVVTEAPAPVEVVLVDETGEDGISGGDRKCPHRRFSTGMYAVSAVDSAAVISSVVMAGRISSVIIRHAAP